MTPSLWLATVLTACGSVLAILAGRRFRSANPRLVAAVELIGLLYLGLLPPILLACIAVGLGGGTSARSGHAGLCFLAAGGGPRIAQFVLYSAAAGLVARTGYFILRALLGAQRAELRGRALAGAARRAVGDGSVWVVPSAKLAAYSAGWRHPKALVTTGLLGLLDQGEQQAVCHHEAAHVRLGHPRLLLLATALADTYRFFPPARAALAQLRRSFEAAADDETVKACGTRPLLCALAKVALAGAPEASLAFAEAEDLRYRIDRLQTPPHSPAYTSSAALGILAVILTTSMAWIVCAAFAGAAPWPAILPCAAGLGWLGSRPARASRHASTSPSRNFFWQARQGRLSRR